MIKALSAVLRCFYRGYACLRHWPKFAIRQIGIAPNRRRALTLRLTVPLVFGGMLTLCPFDDAQVMFGTVVGVVTDSSGATVSGATVKLTNLGTNETRSMQTNAGGTYAFPNVAAGLYRIDIQQAGFKHFIREQVEIQVDVTSRLDATLQVGSVSDTELVTADAPLLQTDSSSLGGVVGQQTVEQMPLSGRNVNNLLVLVPGVVAQGSTYGNAVSNQISSPGQTNAIAFGNYAIGGGFGNQSAFFVDGVSSNGPANNLNGLIPSQDLVQEFRVATNNVSAEYGSYAGGVINIITKSGSNKFHGTAYDYQQNTVFNANDFFSNLAGLSRSHLVQNQFGGTFGGPIQKNKMFFFFGYEGERVHSASLSTTTVPTADELAGIFSDPNLPPIYDQSQPGSPQFSCNGVLNVICPDRIDQTAKLLFASIYPAPNRPGLVNNFITQAATGGVQNQYNARVDRNLGTKGSLFARYAYWKVISPTFDAWGTQTQGQGPTGLYSHEAVLGYTYSLNPRTMLDLRASYVRLFEVDTPDSVGASLSQYGSNYALLQPQLVGASLKPSLNFNGTSGFAASNITASSTGSELYWHQNMYGLSGTITRIFGAHQLKFGGIIRKVQWISDPDNNGINFTYDNEFTCNPAAPLTCSSVAASGTGFGLASALLGIPLNANSANYGGSRAFFYNYGIFVEDTFQATKKLTLNLGARWDQPGIYSEANNNDTVFLPNAAAPINNGASTLSSFVNPVTGQSQPVKGLLSLVDTPTWPSRREDDLHWKLFAPRLGFAYRLTAKTVAHAGYGFSYLPPTLSQDGPDLSPINAASSGVSNTFQVTTGQPNTIFTTNADPFPSGLSQPPRRAIDVSTLYGSTVASRVPGDRYPYVQQWNLAIERQIGDNGSLSIAYAGSKGTHLLMQGFATFSNININQIPDQYLALGVAALQAQVPNPFFGYVTNPSSPLSQPTVATGYLLEPFPQYDRVLAVDPNLGFSSYNSLQASFHERFRSVGMFTAAYTWSKLMTNTDSITSFLDEGNILGGQVQDNNNLAKGERSLSTYDIPQNLTFGYSIDLPFGHGHRLGGAATGVADKALSGWKLNGITTIRSGPPVAVDQLSSPILQQYGAGNGFIYVPGSYLRPNVVPGCDKNVSGSRATRALNGWFNTNCFTLTTSPLEFGDEPRVDPTIRIDGINNWDLALNKQTPITERVRLGFTAEAFNLFNRTRFSGPNITAGSGLQFAIVTATAAPPRALQFGLRLSF